MAFKIIMENSAGELDSRVAETEGDARIALLRMVSELDHVQDGDTFRIVEV